MDYEVARYFSESRLRAGGIMVFLWSPITRQSYPETSLGLQAKAEDEYGKEAYERYMRT